MDIDNVNKVLLERAIKEHSAQVSLLLTSGRDSGACLTQDGGDQKSKLAQQGSGDKWQAVSFVVVLCDRHAPPLSSPVLSAFVLARRAINVRGTVTPGRAPAGTRMAGTRRRGKPEFLQVGRRNALPTGLAIIRPCAVGVWQEAGYSRGAACDEGGAVLFCVRLCPSALSDRGRRRQRLAGGSFRVVARRRPWVFFVGGL